MKKRIWGSLPSAMPLGGREQHAIMRRDISDVLLEHRTIMLWDDVDEDSSRAIVTRILALIADEPYAPIQLVINSYGGSVTNCLAIYDALQSVPAGIQTICFGVAYSAGALLLAAGSKGNRLILPNAEVMIHELSAWVGGSYADIRIQKEHLDAMQKRLTGILAKHTGKPEETIAADTARDKFFSAEDAVKYGLADEVVNGPAVFCNPPSAKRRRRKKAKKPAGPAPDGNPSPEPEKK